MPLPTGYGLQVRGPQGESIVLPVCLPPGFELDSIRTPVLLHHGREDRFVPFGHGQWLSRHIPGVQAELTEDDGHLTLTTRHLDDVHAWLLERLG